MFRRLVTALCAILGAARASPSPSPFPAAGRSTAATAFAMTYGFPLSLFALTLDEVISSIGTNAILNENTTATASGAALVRPNVDTLYSKIAVDLSHNDVSVTIPEVHGDRFYVFPFYDLWGNNFANLGSLNQTAPGNYLLRHVTDASKVGFESAEDGAHYAGYINFPTVYGIVFPRILLRNNSTDLKVVHAIQSQINVAQVSRGGSPIAPSLSTGLLGDGILEPVAFTRPGSLNETLCRELLEIVARVTPFNPPLDPRQGAAVNSALNMAGVSHGRYSPPQDVDYTLANGLVKAGMLDIYKSYFDPINHDWSYFPAEVSGNFGTHYSARAYIAFMGYLQLTQFEAIYPFYVGSGVQGLSLEPNQSYIMTFGSGKPPVKGFWSLTAYNSSSYLIPNRLDRYSLGDRSNLTYPNQEPVYGSNSPNEPFSILIQPADVTPPSNWTNNWLPAPAGGGNFTVNLRFYGPEDSLNVGGPYSYPVVTKQQAVVAESRLGGDKFEL